MSETTYPDSYYGFASSNSVTRHIIRAIDNQGRLSLCGRMLIPADGRRGDRDCNPCAHSAPLTGYHVPITTQARVTTVDILDADMIRERKAAHDRGEGPELLVVVIPKYAPEGTEGWVYRIRKVNVTTVSLDPIAGGRGMKAHPISLAEADEDDVAAYHKLLASTGPPPAAPLHPGTVVTVRPDPRWTQPAGVLYVVLAQQGMTEVVLGRLGGDGGRTWPKIPASLCIPVPLSQVALNTAPTDGGASLTLLTA